MAYLLTFLTACASRSPLPVPAWHDPDPALTLSLTEVAYGVQGARGDDVITRIRTARGPTDPEGHRWEGWTSWDLRWRTRYDHDGVRCSPDAVRVTLDVEVQLPRWRRPHRDDPRWDRYLAALRHHELGHLDRAVRASEILLDRLRAETPHPTCDGLGESMHATADAILEELRLRQRRYDRKTRHGETQGVKWPPRAP